MAKKQGTSLMNVPKDDFRLAPFFGLSWTPLPTLIGDVINERSLKLSKFLNLAKISKNAQNSDLASFVGGLSHRSLEMSQSQGSSLI